MATRLPVVHNQVQHLGRWYRRASPSLHSMISQRPNVAVSHQRSNS